MTDKIEQPTVSNQHFCAHCGTENAKNAYACTRCGERLIEVQTDTVTTAGLSSCARCGSANNTRAAYCWVCGTEMRDAVRITPKPVAEVKIPSATGPRTYRPDLNPVSTPSNESQTARPSDKPDLRGPRVGQNSQQGPDSGISHENPFRSAGSDEPNTSGSRDGEVPAEIKKWNWAAFLMPAVWGLFSGVPLTAVLFGAIFLPVPFGQLILIGAGIFLGRKGNELAWRGKKWRSVEHFKAFQKQWTSWAVKLTVAVGAILIFFMLANGGA
ncbi:zinc ribbon domain-containing protein [Dehalococcoides mccartyi]|nr:zinc ribbon domain-containing protein [Dehalococcoides mccartyi]